MTTKGSDQNPYRSPVSEMIDRSEIDPLWLRLYFAFRPSARCVRRGHDWEYDEWVWKRVCRSCGKFEAYSG